MSLYYKGVEATEIKIWDHIAWTFNGQIVLATITGITLNLNPDSIEFFFNDGGKIVCNPDAYMLRVAYDDEDLQVWKRAAELLATRLSRCATPTRATWRSRIAAEYANAEASDKDMELKGAVEQAKMELEREQDEQQKND